MEIEEKYMRRAIQLAARSPYDTHPNPMVGAVIVHNHSIIGEGYHRRCGQGHAEVNAIASVSDKSLLSDSTMYVTLEPCSHYGKTPPCARLIIQSRIPRVVIAAVDPFEKVAGRGIAMLREAGVEVVSGILADQSRQLNRRFFTAHTLRRPFITLKWAMSADGYMDIRRTPDTPAARFSNRLTSLITHRRRALHDAILTTAATVIADNPRLDCRLWSGPSPRRIILDRHAVLTPERAVFAPAEKTTLLYRPASITTTAPTDFPDDVEIIDIAPDISPRALMTDLYTRGITSLLVEAGPRFLQALIDSHLYDEIFIEKSPLILADKGAHPAPVVRHPSSAVYQFSAESLFPSPGANM